MSPLNPTVMFVAGFLVLFVGGGARFAIGLTLKPMVDELGWARGELGVAVGARQRPGSFTGEGVGRQGGPSGPDGAGAGHSRGSVREAVQ